MFDHIAKLTDNNDHTGAYIEGCEFLGLDDLAKEFKDIELVQRHLGYLTSELSDKRYELYQEMMRKAKPVLGDMFEEFRAAF